ncbi:TonB family protein [Pannonibacter sp. SL95]|uniref:TonB family protein n=1 Tax=Pannonibacter sp. SL95 TaxID=2995153 RepID=UPI0022760D56|nr:TonB family protein [Pannonibacter sp. SL95]MCY1707437.1 TonB family protein [Pannonibacter sp. SL95]
MRLRPWHIGLALGLSLTFHLGAGVIALTREETPQLAGGGVQIGADVGTAFDTVIQSGDPSDTVVAATQPDTLTPETPDPEPQPQPAETPPVAPPVTEPVTEPVRPTEAPRPPVAAIEPAPLQPAADPTPPVAAPVVLPEPLAADPTATLALAAAAPSAPPAQKPAEPVPAVAPSSLAPVVPVEAVKPLPEPVKPEPAKPEPKKADTPKPRKPSKPAAAKARTAAAQTSAKTNAKTSAPAAPAQGGAGGQSNVTALAGGAGRIGTGDAEGNSDVTNYPGQISRALRRALYYPPSAKRRRLTGETLVSFVVAKGGNASSIRVARSSGVPELDEAALETVRRAAPFPAIPPAARRDSWTFTIPIAFR